MKRQVVHADPRTGELVHTYVDLGPGRAVAGHGRPLYHPVTARAGAQNQSTGGVPAMQRRLATT